MLNSVTNGRTGQGIRMFSLCWGRFCGAVLHMGFCMCSRGSSISECFRRSSACPTAMRFSAVLLANSEVLHVNRVHSSTCRHRVSSSSMLEVGIALVLSTIVGLVPVCLHILPHGSTGAVAQQFLQSTLRAVLMFCSARKGRVVGPVLSTELWPSWVLLSLFRYFC